jgi:hypothetical protein
VLGEPACVYRLAASLHRLRHVEAVVLASEEASPVWRSFWRGCNRQL